MKYRIHNGDTDSLIIEGETLEEIKDKAISEITARGWKIDDMWSEEV